ncbi:hypothetical protein MYK68_01740 [Gordonia sp. PP30]|uniref:hypothetical protein n=1 Tax=Gordonia sp. PP30 TaxID=2935861 RepID=UPI001FFF9E71|nr:hypothetical protein [Gordonia sp. PP30]UQE75377.1 hypothetical protein MYK68_01740 [Gordonia sp. PP30]
MITARQRLGVLTSTLLAAVGLASAVGLSEATAAPPAPAYHDFRTGSQYWEHQNSVARFTAQVDPGAKRFMWSLKLQPSVQSIVWANKMACTTTISPIGGYRDDHSCIPADYLLHSSLNYRPDVLHQLRSACTFQVMTKTGLQPGRVDTAIDFRA